jgi:rod shape-determining protein MreD
VSRNRQLFLFIVVTFAFLFQVAVLPQFKLFGVQPDLVLVVAIIVAVQDGPVSGALVGFFGGLLQDLASPQVMGVSALSKALTAFLAGSLKDLFMTYSILLPVLLVFFLSIFELSVHQAVLVVLGQEQLPPFEVGMIVATAFYNTLLGLVVYPLLRRFSFPDKEDSFSVARR